MSQQYILPHNIIALLKTGTIYGLLTIFVIKLLNIILDHYRIRVKLNKIPGPKGLPFIGMSVDMLTASNKEIFDKLSTNYCEGDDGISATWVGSNPVVILSKAKAVEEILSNINHIEKGVGYKYLSEWLGYGLLTSGGKLWHQRRKLLTPAFHFQILDSYVDVFNKHSEMLISKLKEIPVDKAIDITKLVTFCTLDAIMETAMGMSINSQEGGGKNYVKALYREGTLFLQRIGKPWLRPKLGLKLFNLYEEHIANLKTLHSHSLKTIRERKEKLLNAKGLDNFDKKKRLSFLDILLEKSLNENILRESDIREEVDTFVFEGHDTTTSGISFCLFILGWHPEHQKKIQDEMDSIFKNSDRKATIDDVKKMTFLECCIKESFRLYPPVPQIVRHLEEDIVISGFEIPKGTNIAINIMRIHRDPEIFPNPQEFKPERFIPENCANRSPYAFIPFSAGPRNCIGQKFAMIETKIILSSILRKFSIESIVKQEDLDVQVEFVLRPVCKQILLKFKPRTLDSGYDSPATKMASPPN